MRVARVDEYALGPRRRRHIWFVPGPVKKPGLRPRTQTTREERRSRVGQVEIVERGGDGRGGWWLRRRRRRRWRWRQWRCRITEPPLSEISFHLFERPVENILVQRYVVCEAGRADGFDVVQAALLPPHSTSSHGAGSGTSTLDATGHARTRQAFVAPAAARAARGRAPARVRGAAAARPWRPFNLAFYCRDGLTIPTGARRHARSTTSKPLPAALAIVDRLEATITDPALLSRCGMSSTLGRPRALITGRRLAAAPAGCPPPRRPRTTRLRDHLPSEGQHHLRLHVRRLVLLWLLPRAAHYYDDRDRDDHAQDRVHLRDAGLVRAKIFNKMVRELALLGIVSFCAILLATYHTPVGRSNRGARGSS